MAPVRVGEKVRYAVEAKPGKGGGGGGGGGESAMTPVFYTDSKFKCMASIG